MKKKKLIHGVLVLAAVLVFAGCQSPLSPINTHLELEGENFPLVNYKSEKDVIYERTTFNEQTGVTEEVKFQAIASAPAMADAERAALALEAQIKQQETVIQALQMTAQMVPWAISTYKGNPPPTPTPAPIQNE